MTPTLRALVIGIVLVATTSGIRAQSDFMGVDRVPIFFPPYVPPLGRPVVHSTSAPIGGAFPAPPQMAAYVNEIFYPPLATRFAIEALSPKLLHEIEEYRIAKIGLQSELRTELSRLLALADPTARDAGLSDFSRRQTPKIAELEKTAEHLRRSLMSSEQRWGDLRDWHLGDHDQRGFSPVEIALVMRAYSFYDTDLLPAQRRLLAEVALELLYAGENAAKAAALQPYTFFSPEPARVLFPDNIPPPLAKKLSAYESKKAVLKKELYDGVYARDGRRFGFLTGNPLKGLAEKQSVRLAELDTLAEDIRRDYAGFVDPKGPPPAPLSVELMSQVKTLVAAFSNLQKETTGKVDAISAQVAGSIQVSYSFDGDGLRFVVQVSRGARGLPELDKQLETTRASITAVAAEYSTKVAELTATKDALRIEIGRSLGTTKPDVADTALMNASRYIAAQESEDAYREYRTAVFQPGLSGEQRRSLFDYAVEQLELPLPHGDWQPVRRSNSW
jgi:hypothetical protein